MAPTMSYEYYPCEDERYLNGLHIQKAFRDIYDVWSIMVDPEVSAADCEEIEDEEERADLADLKVDAGGWFMVTPTIRCSLEAILRKGWRIQLQRKASSSGKLAVIQSTTYWGPWRFDQADAYGPSLTAAHTILQFLNAVHAGTYRLWRSEDAGARGLFPGLPTGQALLKLDEARATAATAWVKIAETWAEYLEVWPIGSQWEELATYFTSHPDHPSKRTFLELRESAQNEEQPDTLEWGESR